MKIAICLSGAPRFAHRGLFKQLDAMRGFDQADMFIRTWKTKEFGETAEEFEKYLRNNGLPDNCNFCVTQILDDIPENNSKPIDLLFRVWAPYFAHFWYGIVQTNNLRKKYQEKTNANYDAVVRMRTDIVPTGTFDFRDYAEDVKTHMINADNFGDTFLFGAPDMYDRFVGYYDHLQVLSKRRTVIHPEESLRAYFHECGIPYKKLPILFQPVRDNNEYQTRQQLTPTHAEY